MQPNPLLKKLGLADDDRAVIIHTDDIGMCQASLAAYADLVEVGLISAASTMVPCPWFPATAEFCRAHPDKVDMGVHITLTSEWRSGYRWGPLSTRDPASGLLDAEGYFPYTSEEMQAHATPEAVRREIQAQVERAVAAGIDVTHIDTHMGTVFDPRYLESYVQTAMQYRVPPMLVRKDEAGILAMGMGFEPESAAGLARHIEALTAMGLPMVDNVTFVPYVPGEDHVARTQQFPHAVAAGVDVPDHSPFGGYAGTAGDHSRWLGHARRGVSHILRRAPARHVPRRGHPRDRLAGAARYAAAGVVM